MSPRRAVEAPLVLHDVVALPSPTRMVVPVATIRHTARNPRGHSDDAQSIAALVASLHMLVEPELVERPALECVGPDEYVVLYGDRRIRAVIQAGWQHVACDIYPPLDPCAAHERRVMENQQRENVSAIDEAEAIKLCWLIDNATALNLRDEARTILREDQSPTVALEQLTTVLHEAGWSRVHPAVTQQQSLERRGLTIQRDRLRKLFRLLALDDTVKKEARATALTEAGMRALGKLDVEDQHTLVAAIAGDAQLAPKVRRIARKVTERGYPLARALAEARGQVWMGEEAANTTGASAPTADEAQLSSTASAIHTLTAPAISDLAMKFLDTAGSLATTIAEMRELLQDAPITALSPPWNDILQETIGLVLQEVTTLGGVPS